MSTVYDPPLLWLPPPLFRLPPLFEGATGMAGIAGSGSKAGRGATAGATGNVKAAEIVSALPANSVNSLTFPAGGKVDSGATDGTGTVGQGDGVGVKI